MQTFFLSLFVILAACGKTQDDTTTPLGVGDSGSPAEPEDTADGDDDTAPEPGNSGAYEGSAADLMSDAAEALCDSMFRCCDGDAQAWFFQAWRDNTLVADRAADMPPNAPLSPDTCPELVTELMDRTWLGGWVAASEAGEVALDRDGAAACLDELRTADCGETLRDALIDRTCFSVSAPSGGEEQRRFLTREASSGEVCSPIADGFGGLYYGTCNPTEAFCCVTDDTGGCSPYPAVGEAGTCAATTPDGGACTQEAPLQMCETGSSCVGGVCTANPTGGLALGSDCYDPSTYSLLGDCTDGWCDLFGSAKCEPKKSAEATCMTSEECNTEWCDFSTQTCDENPLCNG